MESGLEDRNNPHVASTRLPLTLMVSMESGLEDRNNPYLDPEKQIPAGAVSMESGLEDRNNARPASAVTPISVRLNGVRPRRPEQCVGMGPTVPGDSVSQWSPA